MTNPNLTDITFLLDKSGSMHILRHDLINAFNGFIQEQRQTSEDAVVSLYQFSDRECYHEFYKDLPIAQVEPLTFETYHPQGFTAYYEAMIQTIQLTGLRLAAKPESERPGKVIFIVHTDGQENASDRLTYSLERLQAMVKHQQEVYSWKFVFLGTNLPMTAATGSGFDIKSTLMYQNSSTGLRNAYSALSGSVRSYRTGETKSPTFDHS